MAALQNQPGTEPNAAPPAPSGIDAKTFAIGVLSVTATVLLAAYLILANTAAPAYAIGQIDRAGDYIMLTQQISNSNEAVIVIDTATRQLNMYALDMPNKRLRLMMRNVPLDQMPGAVRGVPIPGRAP